jgi:hypothetical protein
MKRKWPQLYNVMPVGFKMPDDFPAWASVKEQKPNALWIWKPVAQSCGRGIRLFGSQTLTSDEEKKLS